ncbi:hypothetical protein [Hymenobacter sublimis]|uniref:Uncharacterized protein n=1 Tax=Hymenobacter sublimis TaxID=2933777 RepID=A0ABY4J874_9BACT|nr:hypothetical protein [Hymenobacter sublimis]UPL49003.1 hypothetical protein MWH26_17665 [Hymenobacter sublimis]
MSPCFPFLFGSTLALLGSRSAQAQLLTPADTLHAAAPPPATAPPSSALP